MSTPTDTKAPWTANNLLHEIPDEWRDCPICVGDSISRPMRIKRVSLHANRNGSRVIILHEDEVHPLIENA